MLDLSGDQKSVLKKLVEWHLDKGGQYITLGGYAGTGKTTLIAILRKRLRKENKKLKVAFVSYTGKASRVLRNKLLENKVIFKGDYVGTIHSLIYSPIVNSKEEITGWKKKERILEDLVIIDEASMVSSAIWADLLSFDKLIIAVGDHGQLPPIKNDFNLMEDPVLKLVEIHRQAKDNPIIKLSAMARKEGRIVTGVYGPGIKKVSKRDVWSGEEVEEELRNYSSDKMILCGYNKTRVGLNKFIREGLGFESEEVMAGDRVICLRNNHKKEIFNGMLGVIGSIRDKSKKWWEVEIEMDDDVFYSGLIAKEQFGMNQGINFGTRRREFMKGDLFDFGYALTVHKAQGSQAKKVILFEERFPKMSEEEWRQWLYTAITRAEEEILIVGD